jgi:hypothetical protein
MAELADALDSGSSGGNPVEVRVLFRALSDVSFARARAAPRDERRVRLVGYGKRP